MAQSRLAKYVYVKCLRNPRAEQKRGKMSRNRGDARNRGGCAQGYPKKAWKTPKIRESMQKKGA